MAASTDSLNLEMHFARDLLTTGTIESLGGWLRANAPRMSATLEVHAYERDPDRAHPDLDSKGELLAAVANRGLSRGQVYEELVSTYGPPSDGSRRFGHVCIRGRGRGTAGRYLIVDFDSSTPLRPMGEKWLWANSITFNVVTETAEGLVRADLVRHLGNFLAQDEDFIWGAAYLHSEFEASNLDTDNGVRAIGRDVSRHLPGLYWLNYFGQPYAPLLDTDAAARTGVGIWSESGTTVSFECYASPESWLSCKTDRSEVVEALGADLFFDRKHPNQPTRAPDFGVPPGPRNTKLFQVFTSDGLNYTELPPS